MEIKRFYYDTLLCVGHALGGLLRTLVLHIASHTTHSGAVRVGSTDDATKDKQGQGDQVPLDPKGVVLVPTKASTLSRAPVVSAPVVVATAYIREEVVQREDDGYDERDDGDHAQDLGAGNCSRRVIEIGHWRCSFVLFYGVQTQKNIRVHTEGYSLPRPLIHIHSLEMDPVYRSAFDTKLDDSCFSSELLAHIQSLRMEHGQNTLRAYTWRQLIMNFATQTLQNEKSPEAYSCVSELVRCGLSARTAQLALTHIRKRPISLLDILWLALGYLLPDVIVDWKPRAGANYGYDEESDDDEDY